MGGKLNKDPRSISPGPQYNIPSKVNYSAKFKVVETGGYTMGGKYGKDPLNKTFEIPGPGNYSPATKSIEGPRFSMGSKYKVPNGQRGIPGPGQYNDSILSQTGLKYRFGSDSRMKGNVSKDKLVPGPGAYESGYDNLAHKDGRTVFGKDKQRDDSLEKRAALVPGPGQYNQLDTIGKSSPSKTMGGKAGELLDLKEMKSHPGPGQYNPDYTKTKLLEGGYRMSKAAREDVIFNKSIRGKPSPLDYRPSETLTKSAMASYKFGSQSRMVKTSKGDIPGPDKYNIASRAVEGPKYGMGIKTSDLLAKRRESLPGPGQYDYRTFEKVVKKDPSFSVGTSKRLNASFTGASLPGPGNYNPLDMTTKDKAPAYGFGHESRDHSQEKKQKQLPGPGQYESKQYVGAEAQKRSFGGKYSEDHILKQGRNLPGPGQYNSLRSSMKDSPAYKLGTEKRENSIPKTLLQNPDPSRYNIHDQFTKTSAPSFGFGTQQRDSKKTLENPGPGTYESPSKAFGQSRFAMGQKFKVKEYNVSPGPGQYDQDGNKIKHKDPSFSFGGKLNHKTDNSIPGPGQYSVPDKAVGGPQFGFGTEEKSKQKKDSSPGPGHYKIPSKISDLPAYAMPNRPEQYKYI